MDQLRILVWDENNRVVYNGALSSIPLNQEYVLEKGKKIYANLELCPNRYAAIQIRIIEEFLDDFHSIGDFEHIYGWSLLSEKIQNSFHIGRNIQCFKVSRED